MRSRRAGSCFTSRRTSATATSTCWSATAATGASARTGRRPRPRPDAVADGRGRRRPGACGHHRPPAARGLAARAAGVTRLAQLEFDERGDVVIARIAGELDLSNVHDVGDGLNAAGTRETTRLV